MEKIAQKILDDAQKEYDRIIKERDNGVKEIKSKTEQELTRLKAESESQYQTLLEKEKKKLIGMENLKLRNQILHTKREIMDSIFNSALNQLCNKEKGEYLRLIKKLVQKTGAKNGEIIVGREEDKITPEFIEEINKELGTSFSLSNQRADIRGSFILNQEKIELDASFSALLNAERRSIELELSKLLF